MNKQANILFIPSSIIGNSTDPPDVLSQRGYFQQLINAVFARSISKIEGFQTAGWRLAAIARHAHLARHSEVVAQASQLMLALPISAELKSIARYNQALCLKHRGDFDGARQLLEHLLEDAPPEYRARALQIIGATYFESGQIDAAQPFYLSAGRGAVQRDLLTLAESQKMTAVVRGISGDHRRALDDLEKLFPLVQTIGKAYPAVYYDFLNSLAVELGEVGRVTEAEAAISIALASPFADAYPEWSETRDEIAARRISATPSIVAVSRKLEVAPSPHPEQKRKRKPLSKLLLSWLACNQSFLQRASTTIAATAAIPYETQSILERVQTSIGPRAPPVRS